MTAVRPESVPLAPSADSLHMVQASIDLWAFHHWAGTRRLMHGRVFDDGYALHRLLAESIGDLAPQPFRLITPRRPRSRRGVLYGYARVDAEHLRSAARQFADPWQQRAFPPDHIDTKPMPTDWVVGQRLGFDVRVRPIRRPRDANSRRSTERDVFQLEAVQLPSGTMSRSREAVYTEWLETQFQRHGGAHLEDASLASFQRSRAIRRLGQRPSEGPTAVMRGTLSVTDPHDFTRLLARGIGRHRAYGYGMLLLRPASQPSRKRSGGSEGNHRLGKG